MNRLPPLALVASLALLAPDTSLRAAEAGRGEVFSVVELTWRGPRQTPRDTPARDVVLRVRFRHADGKEAYTVLGFYDGDSKGGPTGDVFKVRFCPTRSGRWELVKVEGGKLAFRGPKAGDHVTALPSRRPGFWVVDEDSPGRRWYRRSDGSHPYIFGNTHYSFLSRQRKGGEKKLDIAGDVARNAEYFRKLRFALHGDRYPDPDLKPFLDDSGQPTDDGDFSHRPNPAWFHQRVDVAVREALRHDLIADLILAGPDTGEARSILRARRNGGDATPYLRHIAARYGSYPNVWLCLCNEFDIKKPHYSERAIARMGRTLRGFLPYPTPLSVHSSGRSGWPAGFDALPPWNDHLILQKKLRKLAPSADAIRRAWAGEGKGPRNRPTINDELSYQGAGDRHSKEDTVEAHLGAFLGGGYGTTGCKPGNKVGQYFWGGFDPAEHTAAGHLRWLRGVIEREVTFWKMAPGEKAFPGAREEGFRGMAWPGHEYVLGTDRARKGLVVELPAGEWTVRRHDVLARKSVTLSARAKGRFSFAAPASRAVLFHFKRNGGGK
jgi:hypothetical protein